MATTFNSAKLKLVSQPYWLRVGLYPMAIILALTWIFGGIWLVMGIWSFQYNKFWAVTLLATTLAFGCFLAFMTYKMIADGFRDYVLELTDSEAILSVVDRLYKRQSVQMVLLDDIKYAEYYPFQDSACIIFHTNYTNMEIPLWPLGTNGKDVVDFLLGRGVQVVNVQSDDKIPI